MDNASGPRVLVADVGGGGGSGCEVGTGVVTLLSSVAKWRENGFGISGEAGEDGGGILGDFAEGSFRTAVWLQSFSTAARSF